MGNVTELAKFHTSPCLEYNIFFSSFNVLIYKYFKNLSRWSTSFTTRLIRNIMCGLKAKYLITVSCSGYMEKINYFLLLGFFEYFCRGFCCWFSYTHTPLLKSFLCLLRALK